MMLTIVTKYEGATDTRGARYVARGAGGMVTVSPDYALVPADNHRRAAEILADRMGATVIGGGYDEPGRRYVWGAEMVAA